MKNNRMVLIDLDLNTVELFEDVQELQDIIDRFTDNMQDLENKIIVSEGKILNVLNDKEKIAIVNYYDIKHKIFYDELTYDEWKMLEREWRKNDK